jgi:hypothetical protein
MDIEEIGCHRSGVLHVRCAGEFGIGSGGNVSGALLTRSIQQWIAGHGSERVSEIELDFRKVNYQWGDGPVSAVVQFLRDGVTRFRILASPSNEAALKSLLETCNMPWFELVRAEEVDGQQILTAVVLAQRHQFF